MTETTYEELIKELDALLSGKRSDIVMAVLHVSLVHATAVYERDLMRELSSPIIKENLHGQN